LRWIRSIKDEGMAIGLIDLLARSKFPDSALEVAKDSGYPGDSISLTVAERLVEKAQNSAAQLYLRGWLERVQTVAPETAVRFVEASLAAGDPRIGYAGARQFGFAQQPEPSLQKLALALDQIQAKVEAADVRAALSGGAPLLSATPVEPDLVPPELAPGELPGPLGRAAPGSGSRSRTVLLVDPLDAWRKSLYVSMSTDAQRRMQALFVGPKPPPRLSTLRTGEGRGRDSRFENRGGGARLLKKTSRVLQRTKKISSLRAKRRQAKPPINVTPLPYGAGEP
jgi:hypothetical protein